MQKKYDYIVIGAGVAGSSFAINISKNKKVLILDKREIFSSQFKDYKPCGGLIAPSAQLELFKQGIIIDKSILSKNQFVSVLNLDFDNEKDIYFSKNYFNIDRQKFDQMLLNQATNNENVTFKKELVKEIKKTNGTCKVYTKDNCYECERVINAQGWNNTFTKKLTNKQEIPKYVVIQKLYKNKDNINTNISIFDKEITDYYGWIVPKDNYFELGVAINKEQNKDYNKLFELLEKKLILKGYDLSECIHKEGCQVIRIDNTEQVNLGTDEVINIGEAAGLISPSSAEGYSYALKSARLVAQGLNNNSLNLKKVANSFKIDLNYKLFKKKIMYNKFMRNIVYKIKIYQLN